MKIRLHPLGSAPQLPQQVFNISASPRFESVVVYLRKKLRIKQSESVVCYVNSVFAPGLDEGVGGLWKVSVSLFIDRWVSWGLRSMRTYADEG